MAEINAIVFLGRLPGPTYYAQQFLKYAKEHNICCYIVDVNDEKTFNCVDFDEFAKRPHTFMFTFNNIGIKLQAENGENFWKQQGIPVFNQIVDHPRFFQDTLKDPECDIYVFALDKDHVDYIKQWYKDVKGVYFSPNGGVEVDSGKAFSEREIDVLYMGRCQPEVKDYPVISFLDDYGKDFYNTVISYMLENTMSPTEGAIDWYFTRNGIAVSDEQKFFLSTIVAPDIENTVRRYTKLNGIKALGDIGIHVDIYGDDAWIDKDYPFSDCIVLHNPVSVEEIMEIIGNSKISLCFMPWFKRGSSEKNLDSMLNGALCVTDRSEYLMEHYTNGENIIYFDLNDPQKMAADIKWLLDNPDKAEVIAKRGYETAREFDTWDRRFAEIHIIIKDVLGIEDGNY